MLHRSLTLIALGTALGLAACGGGNDATNATSDTGAGSTATGGTSAVGCRKVAAPEPKDVAARKKPTLRLDRAKVYTVLVRTNCGDFTILLNPRRAPRTGGSFLSLVRSGFYDGLGFHRIAPGFVVQGGDPAGDGTGGPGYKVVEAPPSGLLYRRGIVAMAKGGVERAGTSGSQFFVVLGEDIGLPPEYALLGRVTKGMDAVDRIAAVPANPPNDGTPSEAIVIASMTATVR